MQYHDGVFIPENLLTSERMLMNIGFYINERRILYKISWYIISN